MSIIYQRAAQKNNGFLGYPLAGHNGVQRGYEGDIIDVSAMENHPVKFGKLTHKEYDQPATN